jgi:signal transduction histidine kinase
MSVLAEQKQLYLRTSIDPSVPETVFMDEDAVNKIIINLIGNGIKFTETGGISLDITQRQHNLVIRVQDTGVGIPEHMRDVIFESFRQADASSTRVHGGSGLGLAICRNLCAAMGGSIRVESEMGKGSIFVVTLPLVHTPVNGAKEETAYAVPNI